MWESERTTFTGGTGEGPEMVLETDGNEVRLSFPSGGRDPEHRKLKEVFERAVRRFRPDVSIEWKPRTLTAG